MKPAWLTAREDCGMLAMVSWLRVPVETFVRLALVASVSLATWFALGCAPAVVIPAACQGNDTAYALTAGNAPRGFRSASPRRTVLPPASFRGRATIRMLVNVDGEVQADSTQVLGQTGEDSATVARSAARYAFYPATLNGCAVRSWSVLTITR